MSAVTSGADCLWRLLSTAASRLALRRGIGRRGQKLLPTAVAAKVEPLSITFGVDSGGFVHGHAADGVSGHGFRFIHGHVPLLMDVVVDSSFRFVSVHSTLFPGLQHPVRMTFIVGIPFCESEVVVSWNEPKKTDMAEHPEVFHHVGLLSNTHSDRDQDAIYQVFRKSSGNAKKLACPSTSENVSSCIPDVNDRSNLRSSSSCVQIEYSRSTSLSARAVTWPAGLSEENDAQQASKSRVSKDALASVLLTAADFSNTPEALSRSPAPGWQVHTESLAEQSSVTVRSSSPCRYSAGPDARVGSTTAPRASIP